MEKEVAVATLGSQGECWKPWLVGEGKEGREKGCILHLEPYSSPRGWHTHFTDEETEAEGS